MAPLSRLRRLSFPAGLALGIFLASSCFHAWAGMPSRPNIVLIVADDLGFGDLGCYGGRARTPNLDRLAAEGLRFTDFHSNGSVCSPTRAALMTGRYPHRLGIEHALPIDWGDNGIGSPENRREVTVAARLQKAGYATAIFGKWHLGKHADSNPVRHGFDHFRGLLCGCGDYFAKLDRAGYEDWWNGPERQAEEGYVTDVLTGHAVRFVQASRHRPFFLYLPHLAIHFPWQTPEDATLPTRRKGGDFTRGTPGPDSKLGPHAPEEIPDTVVRMIEALDAGVGALMAALKAEGLDENTLVVFTSDNGGYLRYGKDYSHGISSNGPFRGQKGDVYEGGHRVAAIARWPGKIPAGRVTGTTAMSMDLPVTFLDFAGVQSPPDALPVDGVSLRPLLLGSGEGEVAQDPRTFFWRNGPGKERAVRSGPWKLVRHPGRRPPELYHLENDPAESVNQAGQQPEVLERLDGLLTDWEAGLPSGQPDF